MSEASTNAAARADAEKVQSAADAPGTHEGSVRETHISILVFLGDRVYKLRKPARLPFLDLSSPEKRKEDCLREVRLNRRLAPDVYLGMADVVLDGEPIDHLVVMRALPGERALAHLASSGSDVDVHLDAVAKALCAFHSSARRSSEISACAAPDALRAKWSANFAEMERFWDTVVDREVDREIRALVGRWIDAHTDLLSDRIAGGQVCDGHGDLQASDIFCLDSGVRILDCLQFSDALRYDDVCGDVAFLAMDLERLGRPDAARHFVQAYERHSGALLPRGLLHFHIALRAYIRAKVACIRAEQGSEHASDAARQLHGLARRHLLHARRAVVLVGGLPGSGKTTLAGALGRELGWAVLSSDGMRRNLALGIHRYTPQAMAAVYAELFREARDHLRRGTSVILDASWINADERAQAAQIGTQMQADLIELECTCADTVAAERIRHRLERHDDDSEASVPVRSLMAQRMDPWPTAVTVDTTGSTEDAVERAMSAIATA